MLHAGSQMGHGECEGRHAGGGAGKYQRGQRSWFLLYRSKSLICMKRTAVGCRSELGFVFLFPSLFFHKYGVVFHVFLFCSGSEIVKIVFQM